MNFQFELFNRAVISLVMCQILFLSCEWPLRYEWSCKAYHVAIFGMRYVHTCYWDLYFLQWPIISSPSKFVSNFPVPCLFTVTILQGRQCLDTGVHSSISQKFMKMWPAVWEIFRSDTEVHCFQIQNTF